MDASNDVLGVMETSRQFTLLGHLNQTCHIWSQLRNAYVDRKGTDGTVGVDELEVLALERA